MSGFLLRERARGLAAGLAAAGLAMMAPAGLSGFGAFLQSPPGLAVVSVAGIMLGVTVEETGTLRRIRIGAGLRILSAAILAAAGVWAAAIGAPNPSLAKIGWILFALGAAAVAVALRHDLALLSDLRHGQEVKLEAISAGGLRLRIHGSEVSIPASIITGAAIAAGVKGRGALVAVRGREKIAGDVSRIPWVAATRSADTFVLTEHQAALDAEVLVQRVLEAASAGHQGGYR